MSLRVWLPMTKDLSNQGVENITVTNSGAILDTNGKLGKCYSFNGTYLQFTNPLPSTCSEFSVCGWVRLTSGYAANNGLHLLSFQQTYGRICISKDGLAVRVLLTDGSRNYMGGSTSTSSAVTAGVWNHYAVTFKSGVVKVYINGILDSSATSTVTAPKFTESICRIGTFNTETAKGCVNDFRLYNHELSAKEVEILSRGLVCHYPLNGGGRGGDNIMPNSYTMQLGSSSVADGIWRLAGTSNMNRSRVQVDDGFYAFENSGIQTANDGSCYGIDSFVFEANTTYTMSMIARITEGTEGYAGFAPQNATIIGGTHTKVDKGYSVTPLTTSWKRLHITFTTNSLTTRNIYIGVTTGSTSVTTQMALVKIEKGDKSTPWMPKSTDTEYIKMGYDSNIEYDVSGYGNNGTKQYINYETDTPRYSVSSVLSGSSTRIPNTTINIGNEWSYGLWFKSAAAARSWEGLVILNNSGGDTDIQLGFYTNPNSSQIQTTANGQYNMISHTYDNKWHHLFATFDGTTLKTYKDGELVNTKTITNSLLSRSNLTIGARRRGEATFDCPYKGSLSDFRLYATTLSAEQITELYNTAVSLANNGTLMGYELVEV